MIDAYEFGRIVIDGKEFTSDLIILPERVDDTWWRKEGHNLNIEDLELVIRAKPEALVVGTGATGLMQVPDRTKHYIESKGIKLIVGSTGEACEQYNRLSRTAKTVAALHLTC